MPTLDVIDSFLHQTLGVYDVATGAPGFTTTTRRGNDPASFSISSTSAAQYIAYNRAAFNHQITIDAFAFNVQGLPSAIADFFSVATGAATYYLRLTGSGSTFNLRPRLSVDGTNSTFVGTTNTWYWCEIILDASTTTFSLQYRVGPIGGTIADQPGQTLTGQTAANVAAHQMGCTSAIGTQPRVLYSSWCMGAAASTTDWLGEQESRAYSPNAVGTHNLDAATSVFFSKEVATVDSALTTSETTSYQTIDDVPLSADADAIVVASTTGPATPSLRAAGTAVYSANSVANPTSLTPTKPAATVTGDVLVCITASRSITATVGTPTGWTLVSGFPLRSATASGGSIYVFVRVADGTATDNPTITWTGLTTGTTGDSASARIHAWQGLTTTVDGTAAANDAASTTTITLPSITTTAANSVAIGVAIRINDTAHTFTVATFTEDSDDHTATGTGHGTEVSHLVKATAGATGTATVTPSNTTSSRTLAVTFGLQAGTVTTQPANTQYAEYTFAQEGTLTGDPTAVRTIVARLLESASSSTWAAKLYDGVNVENIFSATVSVVTKVYTTKVFVQRPNTGGVWTLAALNALRLRFGYTAAANGHPRLEAAMIEAIFPVVAAPTTVSDTDASGTITEDTTVGLAGSDANGTTTEATTLLHQASPQETNGPTTEDASIRETAQDASGVTTEAAAVTVPIAGSDASAVASDAATLAVHTTATDNNGTPTEAATLVAQETATDSATGADVATVTKLVPDAGSATDSASLAAAIPASDVNGAVVESATPTKVVTDANGTPVEAATLAAQIAGADASAAGADSASVVVRITATDANGATTESASTQNVQSFTQPDSGGAAESAALTAQVSGGTESSSGQDQATVRVLVASQDASGPVVETATRLAQIIAADNGQALDAEQISVSTIVQDAGASAETSLLSLLVGDLAFSVDTFLRGLVTYDFGIGVETQGISMTNPPLIISPDAPHLIAAAGLARAVLAAAGMDNPDLVGLFEPERAKLTRVR